MDGAQERRQIVSLPKSQQFGDMLRKTIQRGDVKPGDCLSSLAQLAKDYGVGTYTVREAVAGLVQEGLLVKIHGKGTFVAEPKETPLSVAVVVPHLHMENEGEYGVGYNILPRLVQAIQLEAENAGSDVILYLDRDAQDLEARNLSRIAERGADAVILFWLGAEANTPALKRLVDTGIPVVMIDRYVDGLDMDYVVSDNFQASYQVVEQLVSKGFRQVHYFTDVLSPVSASEDRIGGYRQAAADLGLECCIHIVKPVPPHRMNLTGGSYHEVAELLEGIEGPFAVFAKDSEILEAVWRVISSAGRPHEGLALASFDDLGMSIPPGVLHVTVKQPFGEMGRRSVRLAIDRAKGKLGHQHIMLPCEINVTYGSTLTPPREFVLLS